MTATHNFFCFIAQLNMLDYKSTYRYVLWYEIREDSEDLNETSSKKEPGKQN